ncbi:hypothetical protein AB0F13_18040 [Streptomyces sp. NPDC026206]|uniref:hypothetical protein n=1 Tax=Streptomyces sp. NPDC026206 TaxID=3157089 RepID=UPI003407C4C7
MFGRRGIGIALSSLTLLGASLVAAPAARAHTPIACAGQENTRYTPGLQLAPRPTDIVAEGTYTCSDAPGHTVAATTRITATTPQGSCLTLGSVRARETVRYGDGRTSVISYTTGHSVRVLGVNNVRLDGVVVEGLGKGARAQRAIQTAPADLPTTCLAERGLQQVVSFTQLHILP